MADNGRWFKLWITAPYDPHLSNLSLEDFARWCLFGIYLKTHGNNGIIEITSPAIAIQQLFRVTNYDEVMQKIACFPSCQITVTSVTTVSVTFRNWLKYQGDFSGDRVRKFRNMKRTKKRGEEKRGEEIRGEENNKEVKKEKMSCQTPATLEDFISKLKQNTAYKNIDIDRELQKMDAWLSLPKAKGRKKTKQFVLNWLNKVDPAHPIEPNPITGLEKYKAYMKRRDEDEQSRSGQDIDVFNSSVPGE